MDRQITHSGDQSEILLVEDNPGDVRLVEEALQDTQSTLHVAGDGQEALDFIHQRDEFADVHRPDVVFLDLNLPRVDGEQFLHEVRDDPDLEQLRVVILTSATEDSTAVESRDLDADVFRTKPADPEEFMELIRSNVEARPEE